MARFAAPGAFPRRVRVHLAPEHREDVLYQLQRFADNKMIDYVPLQTVGRLGPA
jgi:hypothetical protein